MTKRWISYDAAYEQVAEALSVAGGLVAETEQFLVGELEAGRLKARAATMSAMAPNVPDLKQANGDVPPAFWTAWRLTKADYKNSGPDFGWATFTHEAGRHRQSVSGLMIETYGLSDIVNAMRPASKDKEAAEKGNTRGRPKSKELQNVLDELKIELLSRSPADIAPMHQKAFQVLLADRCKVSGVAISSSYADSKANQLRRAVRTAHNLPTGRHPPERPKT